MQQDSMSDAEAKGQLVSALVDDELQGQEFSRALALLRADPQARARWHDYHQWGDVMRQGSRAALATQDDAFLARLRERLAQEVVHPGPVVPVQMPVGQDSANDGIWRWKLVAGLSSLAVLGGVVWQLVASSSQHEAAQLAQARPTPVAVAPVMAESLVMIRDPRLDQLIAAHQQQGGASALQMPAGFLRNATFERPAR